MSQSALSLVSCIDHKINLHEGSQLGRLRLCCLNYFTTTHENQDQDPSSINANSAHLLLLNLLTKELQVIWIRHLFGFVLSAGKNVTPNALPWPQTERANSSHGSSDSAIFILFKCPGCLLVITSDIVIGTGSEYILYFLFNKSFYLTISSLQFSTRHTIHLYLIFSLKSFLPWITVTINVEA